MNEQQEVSNNEINFGKEHIRMHEKERKDDTVTRNGKEALNSSENLDGENEVAVNCDENTISTSTSQTGINDRKFNTEMIPRIEHLTSNTPEEGFVNVDSYVNDQQSCNEGCKSEITSAQKAVFTKNSNESVFVKTDQNLQEPCTHSENVNISQASDLNNSVEEQLHYKFERDKCSASDENIAATKNSPNCKNILSTDEDTICGFGSFRPKWMQQWATEKVYVVLYSILGIVQGAYHPYVVGCISTLEKRFAFESKISGIVLSSEEITPLVLGIFVGYFAGKAHRPRMVALGMLVSAFCCFISALPFFMYGPARQQSLEGVRNHTGAEYCDTEKREDTCNSYERPPTLTAVSFLILGSFMKGFGSLAYYAVGLPYMDDNSKKKNTPLYLAISIPFRLLGPIVGYLMASAFLKFYENPFDDPGYGPDDPRWIGAWWMGFCVQGVLLLIFTFPIAMFPRRLPTHNKPVQKEKDETLRELLVGLLAALKRLGKNRFFVVFIFNTTLAVFGHYGHHVMLPKYMENQFRLSASQANLLSSAPAAVCIMISIVIGGIIIWKYEPNTKQILTALIVTETAFVIFYIALLFPQCQNIEVFNFGKDTEGLMLDGTCNQNCNCSTTAFSPYCGQDGKTLYFSPCYAGCTIDGDSASSTGSKVFENCSCAKDVNGQLGANITAGYCPDENCWSQTITYVVILLIMNAIGNSIAVGDTMLLLRCVDPADKSIAIGTFESFICLFGFIIFPVTVGALVDSACIVWEKNCGDTGNCWLYDMDKFNYIIHAASSCASVLITLFFYIMYRLSAEVRSLYTEEE